MIKRWSAGLLGLMAIGNGLFMIIAAKDWYLTAPGASDTGPFNPHFVWDIGIAFSVAGAGLIARAWRARYWPAAVTGAAFLFGHGLIHIAGLLGGHTPDHGMDRHCPAVGDQHLGGLAIKRRRLCLTFLQNVA